MARGTIGLGVQSVFTTIRLLWGRLVTTKKLLVPVKFVDSNLFGFLFLSVITSLNFKPPV